MTSKKDDYAPTGLDDAATVRLSDDATVVSATDKTGRHTFDPPIKLRAEDELSIELTDGQPTKVAVVRPHDQLRERISRASSWSMATAPAGDMHTAMVLTNPTDIRAHPIHFAMFAQSHINQANAQLLAWLWNHRFDIQRLYDERDHK